MSLQQVWAQRGSRWGHVAIVLLAAVTFHWIDDHDHNPAVTALLLGVLALSAYGKLPVLRTRPFLFISGISYSLYLLHNNLGCLVIRSVHDAGLSPAASVAVAIALSVAVATGVTVLFERPVTRMLNQTWKRLAARSAQPQPSQLVGESLERV